MIILWTTLFIICFAFLALWLSSIIYMIKHYRQCLLPFMLYFKNSYPEAFDKIMNAKEFPVCVYTPANKLAAYARDTTDDFGDEQFNEYKKQVAKSYLKIKRNIKLAFLFCFLGMINMILIGIFKQQ